MLDLVLEYSIGYGPTRKFWLRSGETVRVGGTDWADYAVETDSEMSPVHFSVTHAGDRALVRDLNSRNGTYRNGEQIAECNLRNGDTIRAGQTDFHATVSNRLSYDDDSDTQSPSHAGEVQLDYQVHTQVNGITRLHSVEGTTKATVAAGMMSRMRLGILINAKALSMATLADMSWISRAIQLDESMLMLSIEHDKDFQSLDDIWGRDSCVVVASEADNDTLHRQVRANSSAFYRSRIVRSQLSQAPAAYVEILMSNLKAVMVESEDGAGWELFTTIDSPQPWEALGCPPPDTVAV